LTNHIGQIAGADFLLVPTATSRVLFVLVILAYQRRRARGDHRPSGWAKQYRMTCADFSRAPTNMLLGGDLRLREHLVRSLMQVVYLVGSS
jgi:hypothetical protein